MLIIIITFDFFETVLNYYFHLLFFLYFILLIIVIIQHFCLSLVLQLVLHILILFLTIILLLITFLLHLSCFISFLASFIIAGLQLIVQELNAQKLAILVCDLTAFSFLFLAQILHSHVY